MSRQGPRPMVGESERAVPLPDSGPAGGRGTPGTLPKVRYARRASDEGAGTMAGVALIMCAAVLLSIIVVAGRLLVCRAEAGGAADVAALSAATALRDGADPCHAASRVASGYEMRMLSCTTLGESGEDVAVRIAVDTQVPFWPEITAQARAGPVPCDEP